MSEELVWKTREGEKIPISKLDDRHLKNIYKYVELSLEGNSVMPFLDQLDMSVKDKGRAERARPWLIRWKEAIEVELKKRNSMDSGFRRVGKEVVSYR